MVCKLPQRADRADHFVVTWWPSLFGSLVCRGPGNHVESFLWDLGGIHPMAYQQFHNYLPVHPFPHDVSFCHQTVHPSTVCRSLSLLAAPGYRQDHLTNIVCRVDCERQRLVGVLPFVCFDFEDVQLQNLWKTLFERNIVVKCDAVVVNLTKLRYRKRISWSKPSRTARTSCCGSSPNTHLGRLADQVEGCVRKRRGTSAPQALDQPAEGRWARKHLHAMAHSAAISEWRPADPRSELSSAYPLAADDGHRRGFRSIAGYAANEPLPMMDSPYGVEKKMLGTQQTRWGRRKQQIHSDQLPYTPGSSLKLILCFPFQNVPLEFDKITSIRLSNKLVNSVERYTLQPP